MPLKNLEKRLEAVLEEFERLADSDPIKLRTLIPPTEIWRLFVESCKQKEYFILDKCLHKDKLKEIDLNVSLKEVTGLKSIIKQGWPGLIQYLNLSHKATECITLSDLIEYNQGWFLFELGEPGYIKALYRAFQCIFEKHNELNLEFILKIHQISTAGVANTNYRLFNLPSCGGKLRTEPGIGFALKENNSSEDGIYEILQKNNSYASFLLYSWSINSDTPRALRQSYYWNKNDVVYKRFPAFHEKIRLAKDNRELAAVLFEFIRAEPEVLYFLSYMKGDVKILVSNEVDKAISKYNLFAKDSNTPLEKISSIVEVIHTLEDIHMFTDANCRTLCMITMNHLLHNLGLPLSFINDANRFDAKSQIELIETIIEGMENVFRLIQTKTLNNIHTSDLLALADKANTIGATRKYFEEAVAIEERSRRRLYLARNPSIKREHEEETLEIKPKRLQREKGF